MEWQIVVALVIAVPVILFPAAFVWYLNLGGLYATVKEARAKKVAQEKGTRVNTLTTASIYDRKSHPTQPITEPRGSSKSPAKPVTTPATMMPGKTGRAKKVAAGPAQEMMPK